MSYPSHCRLSGLSSVKLCLLGGAKGYYNIVTNIVPLGGAAQPGRRCQSGPVPLVGLSLSLPEPLRSGGQNYTQLYQTNTEVKATYTVLDSPSILCDPRLMQLVGFIPPQLQFMLPPSATSGHVVQPCSKAHSLQPRLTPAGACWLGASSAKWATVKVRTASKTPATDTPATPCNTHHLHAKFTLPGTMAYDVVAARAHIICAPGQQLYPYCGTRAASAECMNTCCSCIGTS